MEPDCSIRKAAADDAAALSLVGGATFLETYAEKIPGPDIVAHVAKRHAPSVYEEWLADPAIHIWLAQSPTKAAIGYLVLMPAALPVDDPQPGDLEVQRIYVLSRFHGVGIGFRLMATAIEAAERLGASRLLLGVLKTNELAVAFYRRQGFSEVGGRQFHVGGSVFDDFILGRSSK